MFTKINFQWSSIVGKQNEADLTDLCKHSHHPARLKRSGSIRGDSAGSSAL